MYIFYILAVIPILIGGGLYFFGKKVHLLEWLACSLISLLISGIIHYSAYYSATKDFEIWSGQVISVEHHPAFSETWTELESYSCGTTKNPKTCYRTVRRYASHSEYWSANCTVNGEFDISKRIYDYLVKSFGSKIDNNGTQFRKHSGSMVTSGNSDEYICKNATGYIEPTVTTHHVTNKILGARTLYGFVNVPDTIPVYPYPKPSDQFISNRLIGLASKEFTRIEFDRMNSRLGPRKKVNVVLVGFNSTDSSLGNWQQSKWIGGKKNDLIITYGTGWSYVFGWTESELCKKNLQTLFLENKRDDNLLKLVESEINKNYTLVNWDKFNYISIDPPTWSYVLFFFLQIIIMGIAYFISCTNTLDKDNVLRKNNYTSYTHSSYRRW